MRVLTRVLIGLAIVVGYVSMTGCGPGSPIEAVAVPLNARLVNGEAQAVHIFAPGETFPCCQVAADGERSWRHVGVTPGDEIQFRAGRNGEIIGSVTCTVDDAFKTGKSVSVIWTGVGMACGGTW